MKSTTFRRFGVAVAFCASLVLSVASGAFAQEAESPCPFLDDEAILYFSPSTLAKVPSVQKVWSTSEAKEALDMFFAKVDGDISKGVDKEGEPLVSKYNKFRNLVCDYAETASFSRALFNSYFKCVDGVVLGFESPEDLDGKKEEILKQGLTLTYILNVNPSAIEPRNFFDKEEGVVEILKENENEVVGKLNLKKGDKVEAEIFYGGAKVKDMDKYVIVLAGTQANVEKKVTRFQNTNAFIAKRQNADLLYANFIFKEKFFQAASKQVRADENNEQAQAVAEGLKKTKSFQISANGAEDGVCWSATVETTDAETAKTFADLLSGALAMSKIQLGNKANPTPEEQFILDLLKQVEVSCEQDATSATCALKVNVDQMDKVVKRTCKEFKKNCQ